MRNILRAMTERHLNKVLTPASIPNELLSAAKATDQNDSFEADVAKLLVRKIELLTRDNPGMSLRKLATDLKISRSTLMRKLAQANDFGLLNVELQNRLAVSN